MGLEQHCRLLLALFLCFSVAFTSNASASPPGENGATHSPSRSQFPQGFVFGAAISSYQSEGAATQDGKGQSIWDFYTHKYPERILDRSNGDLAANSYHLYKKDIQLVKDMGMSAYRISISWPRILPTGKLAGRVNQKGVQFYNDVINDMLAQGITPFITLFHWDLPQALQEEYGGFLSNRIVNDFRDYADVCFNEFGDRVKHWITLNEPHSLSNGGYSEGVSAPGRCTSSPERKCEHGNSATEPYIVTHNQLLAHASAVQLYRQKYQATQKGMIGITLNSNWYLPFNESHPADVVAVGRALDFVLGWMLNPIVRGEYPETMRTMVGERLPKFTPEEAGLLKGSMDFLGVNYYTSFYAQDIPRSKILPPHYRLDGRVALPNERNGVPIGKRTAANWLCIYPKGFRELLLYIKKNYNDPIMFITENGAADNGTYPGTKPGEPFQDSIRIEYYDLHLSYLSMAIKEGANVKGYFAWSLVDNFEWADGYTVRFGLYHVDFKDPSNRVPKQSALWFKQFMESGAPKILT